MRLSRPSGLTLLTCALLVLLPTLAVLQYRWVGEVSRAEQDRMQRNLRTATLQFRDAFDVEVGRAFLNLQVGPLTARDGASDQYSDRYDQWVDTAEHPRIVSAIYLIDAAGRRLRLRQWNAATHTFEATPWPAALDTWRPQLEQDLVDFEAGRPVDRRASWPIDDALLIAPMRNLVTPASGARPQSVSPVFGYTALQLDLRYIQEEVFPALAARHFSHTDGSPYRVAIVGAAEPSRVVYQSDPGAPVDPAAADASEPIFGAAPGRGPSLLLRGGGPRREPFGDGAAGPRTGPRRPAPPAGDLGGPGRPRPAEAVARWRVLVQHESGSLETAVAMVRRRNLGISFGVLLLLSVSVALLTVTSRRAHRLAQQQMEFVAGVSHELRTPVAVIRTAAENLSVGVVTGDRVRRYGDVIGAESRRLGEMVESILQYAGFESGLGLGAQVPVSPAEIIAAAVSSATGMDAADGVTVEQDVPPDLPRVLGDAAALRSAVQNLVANAVKYGGSDRWVGVRARLERHRRRAEVVITISDHGTGIPASELPHIFEPFYRGSDAVGRQIHGNGLGLSLVQRIVHAHGGRVSVTARPGLTAFTMSLPVAAEAAHARPVAQGTGAVAHS